MTTATRLVLALSLLAGCGSGSGVMDSSPARASLSRTEKVGKGLYEFYCSNCHGDRGDGDGIHGYGLDPPPPALVDTAGGVSFGAEQLLTARCMGPPDAGMPAATPWKQTLSENQARCIAVYLRRLPGILPPPEE